MPGVVEWARALPVRAVVLDGEAIGVDEDERPHAFQDTMSSFGSDAASNLGAYFFDVLHVDGDDLVDRPLTERLEVVQAVVGERRIPGIVTASPDEAAAFLDAAIAAGHEGVMVKSVDSTYDAGRRGGAWRKVKPVKTLDLVVLAAEWGHGRREGWLSNLHLGARGPDGTFVMVGKTFKGLTDALLEWQTQELLAREIGRDGIVVHVRPELVVEIALDGVQASRRYPGGVALRFARVRRYRDDKTAADGRPDRGGPGDAARRRRVTQVRASPHAVADGQSARARGPGRRRRVADREPGDAVEPVGTARVHVQLDVVPVAAMRRAYSMPSSRKMSRSPVSM